MAYFLMALILSEVIHYKVVEAFCFLLTHQWLQSQYAVMDSALHIEVLQHLTLNKAALSMSFQQLICARPPILIQTFNTQSVSSSCLLTNPSSNLCVPTFSKNVLNLLESSELHSISYTCRLGMKERRKAYNYTHISHIQLCLPNVPSGNNL